jgi:hypothetical protein
MTRAAELYDKIYQDFPGGSVRRSLRVQDSLVHEMNLREAVHLCELRTMPQAIRLPVHAQVAQNPGVHPVLAEVGRFID